MTYQEILSYINDKGKKVFNNNLIMFKDASYYNDEFNYRLLFYLNNTHISIDIEMRNPHVNSIMIWGLEEEVGKINKKNIDRTFLRIENFLDRCLFIKYYTENELDFGEFYLDSLYEFNESEVNDWFNSYENENLWQHLKNKKYQNGKDRVKKLEIRYKYFGTTKIYLKHDDNLFHLQ
ncbi:hypothetical protein [Haploplasma axanthum]|uniref:Uncharacterized protein n=1 Tax=Haploplasma axanthum TaxID=29552 RepID=A0A449BEZ7_HAPAX|nr:hypothetical protein [Haploplasma axanthum]VEU81033.1 Uncharacterised protein [Haploplasma axanthum]